jgi:hypothetical protein
MRNDLLSEAGARAGQPDTCGESNSNQDSGRGTPRTRSRRRSSRRGHSLDGRRLCLQRCEDHAIERLQIATECRTDFALARVCGDVIALRARLRADGRSEVLASHSRTFISAL